jgi:hypothetical protein
MLVGATFSRTHHVRKDLRSLRGGVGAGTRVDRSMTAVPEELSTPIPAVVQAFRGEDEVGTLRTAEGETMRFGRTAFGEVAPFVGQHVFVTAVAPHPLGGRRAVTVRLVPETEAERRQTIEREIREEHLRDEQAEADREAGRQRRLRHAAARTGTLWQQWFDDFDLRPAPADGFVDSCWSQIFLPPGEREIEAARVSGLPAGVIERWWLPDAKPVPGDYSALMRVSNGGSATRGERAINFLGVDEIREMMWCYEFPWHVRGFIPFATDGGGRFFAFRFDAASAACDPQVYLVSCGAGERALIASSLREACTSDEDIDAVADAAGWEPADDSES